MEIEKSLVFIKPGNEGKIVEIVSFLDNSLEKNFHHRVLLHVDKPPRALIEEHYINLRGKSTFEVYVEAFVKGSVDVTIYHGEKIIQRIRKVLGDTDPQKAAEGTIRRVFSNDSLEEAIKYTKYVNNVMHSSGNVKEAEKEIELWSRYYDILSQ